MYALPIGYTKHEAVFGLPSENAMHRGLRGLPFNSADVVWVAQRSGNFNTPSIWLRGGYMANAVPTTGANIYVPKGVTLTINQTYTARDLRVDGALIFDSTVRTLTINNNCHILGALNMAGSGSTAHTLVLNGNNNYIEPSLFISGSGSIILYTNNNVINIEPINYNILSITLGDRYAKYLTCKKNITASSLNLNSCFFYIGNFSFNNIINITGIAYKFIKNGGDDLIINNLSGGSGPIMEIYNSNLIVRGGISSFGGFNALGEISRFIGNIIFNINNQNVGLINGPHVTFTGNWTIDNVVITNILNSNSILNGILNGTTISSRWDNRGTLVYQEEQTPMLLGEFYCNQAANIVNYNRGGNQDIRVPDDGQYRTLIFGGSGSKKLLGNIVCDVFELSSASATIDYNGFTITVNNELRLTGSSQDIPLSTSLIIGVNCDLFIQGGIKKLLENVVFRNLTFNTGGSLNFNGFTATISNNIIFGGNAGSLNFPAISNLIHTGNVFIRNTGVIVVLQGSRICTELIFDSGNPTITFAGFTLTSTTTQYIANASQSVWGTANQPLTNLTLGGTASPNNKTLQGNVSVPGTYTTGGNAVRVDNGFTFGNP